MGSSRRVLWGGCTLFVIVVIGTRQRLAALEEVL